ncbi:MAG: hypothetical protein ASARMPREDX12_003945 [Alectoria sarmentosa]|nr:MAG: hypothetical protein ASARMPREDX12_003945 [Alectoria sarmentosa]
MRFQRPLLLFYILLSASHVSSTVVVQNATYDDLTSTPILDTPVGTYKNLTYNAWVIAGPLTPGVTVGGVASQSPPNAALKSVDTQLTNGRPTFTIVEPYKSFSLSDFYFGCQVRTDERTLVVATQCTITVAGFEANNDEEVALASFTFTPPLEPLTSVPTIHAVLPATFLLPLSNVTIVQSNELADLKVDSLRYDVST